MYSIQTAKFISILAAVCSLRLDFESFTLNGIGNTQEVMLDDAGAAAGAALCRDSMTVTVRDC